MSAPGLHGTFIQKVTCTHVHTVPPAGGRSKAWLQQCRSLPSLYEKAVPVTHWSYPADYGPGGQGASNGVGDSGVTVGLLSRV